MPQTNATVGTDEKRQAALEMSAMRSIGNTDTKRHPPSTADVSLLFMGREQEDDQ